MALPASRKRATPVDDDKDGGGSDARPRKRKKTRRGGGGGRSQKTQKMRSETAAATPSLATAPRDSAVKQDLLARYYPRVETLRAYLLTRLPASSRIRRKRLAAVGATAEPSAVEQLLSRLLDMTLVACGVSSSGDGNGDDDGDPPDGLPSLEERGDRERLRETFSQTKRADESYVTVSNAAEGAFSPQAEVGSVYNLAIFLSLFLLDLLLTSSDCRLCRLALVQTVQEGQRLQRLQRVSGKRLVPWLPARPKLRLSRSGCVCGGGDDCWCKACRVSVVYHLRALCGKTNTKRPDSQGGAMATATGPARRLVREDHDRSSARLLAVYPR